MLGMELREIWRPVLLGFVWIVVECKFRMNLRQSPQGRFEHDVGQLLRRL